MRADEPGSLVISEYYYHYPASWYASRYDHQGYLELYNNADSAIYLDGKIIGSAFNYNIDGSLWSCEETRPMRIAEGGIYAQFLHRFPGSGHDYRVDPGETVLIADQAIDHSAAYSELPDLTGADFEFGFADRADNPLVPNLIEVGLRPITGNTVPFRFLVLFDVAFIAAPLDIAGLARRQAKYQGEFAFIPADAIVDLAAFVNEYELTAEAQLCRDGSVYPALDGLAAWTPFSQGTNTHLLSVQRRTVPGTGRLQRTRTSRVDFEIAPRSPGWIR